MSAITRVSAPSYEIEDYEEMVVEVEIEAGDLQTEINRAHQFAKAGRIDELEEQIKVLYGMASHGTLHDEVLKLRQIGYPVACKKESDVFIKAAEQAAKAGTEEERWAHIGVMEDSILRARDLAIKCAEELNVDIGFDLDGLINIAQTKAYPQD